MALSSGLLNEFSREIAENRHICTNGTGLNNPVFICNKPKRGTVKAYPRSPCYNPLSWSLPKDSEPLLMLDRSGRFPRFKNATKEQKEYVSWLVNRSPWRFAFLNKDLEDIFGNGFISPCSLPARYVVQAGILLREVGDKPHIIKLFSKFKKCMPSAAAIVFAHMVIPPRIGSRKYIRTYGTGHTAVNPSRITKTVLRNIASENFEHAERLPPMTIDFTYNGSETLWIPEENIQNEFDNLTRLTEYVREALNG